MFGAKEIAFTIIFACLTILTIFLSAFGYVRNIGKEKGRDRFKTLAILLFGGFAVRIVLALFIGGNRYDLTELSTAANYFSEYGFSDYYALYDVKVFPIAYYSFGIFGSLASLLKISSGTVYFYLFLKLPLIISDLLSAFIIYVISKRFFNERIGLVSAALVLFCPAFFLSSAVWGAQEILCMPLLLFSFYALISKKNVTAIVAYSLATITNKNALFVFPLFVVYYAYYFVLAIKETITLKKGAGEVTFKSILALEKTKSVVIIPFAVMCSFLVQYLVTLPLSITSFNANPFLTAYHLYIGPIFIAERFTFNGLGIYSVFGKNASSLPSGFPTLLLTIILLALTIIIVCVVYFSKKNRAATPLVATLIYYTIVCYGFDTTLNLVVPALILIIVSFVFTKDKRLLIILLLSSIAFVLGLSSVMSNGNFFGVEGIEAFKGATLYSLSSVVSGATKVVLIISAALSVLSHLLLAFVTFDVTINDSRSLLLYKENASFNEAVKNLFSSRRI
jgi:hypothetical protein